MPFSLCLRNIIVILKNHQRSLSFIIIIIISTYFLNICIMQIHVACKHACHACAPLNIFPYATCMNMVAYNMRICLQCCIVHTLFVQLIHLLHMLHCCIALKQAIAFVKSQSLKRSRNETFWKLPFCILHMKQMHMSFKWSHPRTVSVVKRLKYRLCFRATDCIIRKNGNFSAGHRILHIAFGKLPLFNRRLHMLQYTVISICDCFTHHLSQDSANLLFFTANYVSL